MWKPVWDAIFSLSSGALVLFFGVALGNVARGVPIDATGSFFEPLWTDFSPRQATGILDPYTICAGLTALAALAQHGALWLALKTERDLRDRAIRAARISGFAAAGLTVVVTIWTGSVQPRMAARFAEQPWGAVFPLVAAAGLVAAHVFRKKGQEGRAFLASTAYLVGMMSSVAFSIFPYVLPCSTDPARGLTVQAAAADAGSLRIALAWWLPGVALAGGYFVFIYSKFAGKVPSADEHY
jgi:cytochrome d ubiquinol oxidase subunit II